MTTQPGLFAEAEKESHLEIPGLGYYRDLLDEDQQLATLREVDAREWRTDLKRRVQHYGYKYDYKARAIDYSMYVGPLPSFAVDVAQLLMNDGLIEEMPDQLIVNEYEPGQGISAHIDCEPCFREPIVTISLGWAYEMDFIHVETGKVLSTVLAVGSALVLRGDSRNRWMHRIRPKKKDGKVPRKRRVSLTFRNVILDN
jgi:alkylated DNA repair dioxygenase AlkB